VLKRFPANAFCTVEFFLDYHGSRGNVFPESPVDPIRQAIVKGSDYLGQKFRYKGTKLLQYLAASNLDPFLLYLDPWLVGGFGFGFGGIGVPGFRSRAATTSQYTVFPRAGVIDFNGDQCSVCPASFKRRRARARCAS
jgi:hypothetical protein